MSNKWEVVLLGEICDIQAGGTPSRHKNEYWINGNIPWVKIGDMNSKFISSTNEFITESGLKNSAAKLFPKGTLLFSIFATLGAVSILDIEATTNQAIAGINIKSRKDVYNFFLYYYLISIKKDIEKIGRGVAQNNINLGILKRYPISIPSFDKQVKIAQILDKASELIEKRKEQLRELDRLAESVFYDMFGDPVTNSKRWEKNTLKNLTTKIGSGATPKGGNENYKNEGISLIRSLNIYNAKFKYKDLAFIDELQAKSLDGVTIEPNDVLLNITGASVARCCVVPNNILPARVNQHVSILRTKEEELNYIFLCYLLISNEFQNKLLKDSKNNGATREALTKSDLENLPIITPPLELQHQFASIIEKIEAQKAKVKAALKESEDLFQRLMQDMFNPEYHEK